MPARRTQLKKTQHAPGDIVFAKLKGYPWWPAKVQDETKVPKNVMETKRKKKVCFDAVTVFFFGSLDYAFISEKLIRPFDHDAVRKGIPNGKFKNKDLVLALEQALDPNGLDFFFKPQKLEAKGKKRKQQPDATNNTTTVSTATATEATEAAAVAEATETAETATITATATATAAATAATSTDTNASTPSSQQEMPTKINALKRPLDIDSDDSSNKKKRHKSPSDSVNATKGQPTANNQTRPFSYTSKALEAACQKSVEYERAFKRLYVMRHKLQNLTYQKKPGEIPLSDYPAIDAILTDIEKYDMTKELLKETQIGKIVRFGCTYRFDLNYDCNLQERCLRILKTWATTLLDLSEYPPRQSPTKAKTIVSPLPAVNAVSSASTSSAASSNGTSSSSSTRKVLSSTLRNGKAADDGGAPLAQQEDDSIDFRTEYSTALRMVDPCPTDRKGKKKAIMVPVLDSSSNSNKEMMTTKHMDYQANENFISSTVLPLAKSHQINYNNRVQRTPAITRSEAITTMTTSTTPQRVDNQSNGDQKSSTHPLTNTNEDDPVSGTKATLRTPPFLSNEFDDNTTRSISTPPTLPLDNTDIDVENNGPISSILDKSAAPTTFIPPSTLPIDLTNVDIEDDEPISNIFDEDETPPISTPPPTLPIDVMNVDVEEEEHASDIFDKDATPPISTSQSLPSDHSYIDVEDEESISDILDKHEAPPTSTRVTLPIYNNGNEYSPPTSTTHLMIDSITEVHAPEKPTITETENVPSSSSATHHHPSSPPRPPIGLPTHFLYSLETRPPTAPTTSSVPQTSSTEEKQESPSSTNQRTPSPSPCGPVQLLTHFPYSLETCPKIASSTVASAAPQNISSLEKKEKKQPKPIAIPITFKAAPLGRKINNGNSSNNNDKEKKNHCTTNDVYRPTTTQQCSQVDFFGNMTDSDDKVAQKMISSDNGGEIGSQKKNPSSSYDLDSTTSVGTTIDNKISPSHLFENQHHEQ